MSVDRCLQRETVYQLHLRAMDRFGSLASLGQRDGTDTPVTTQNGVFCCHNTYTLGMNHTPVFYLLVTITQFYIVLLLVEIYFSTLCFYETHTIGLRLVKNVSHAQ